MSIVIMEQEEEGSIKHSAVHWTSDEVSIEQLQTWLGQTN